MMRKTAKRPARKRRSTKPDIRSLLLRRRDELVAQMHGQFKDSRFDHSGGGFDDVADRATDSFYSELAQGFAEIAAADLTQIDRVIERIDEHKYGLCSDCGQPIPKARLRLLPFAERCVRCQELDERMREPVVVAPRRFRADEN